MKLPKHFNVFGKKIKVKTKDLGESYLGLYYPTEGLIVIHNKIDSEDELNKTVVHEFIHSVIDRCSLNQVISYPSEEVLVEMITKALLENFEMKCLKK